MPVRHPRPGNGHRAYARELVHPGTDLADEDGRAVHDGTGRMCCGLDRGTLAVGAPADVTVFDPERRWTYDVNQSPSKSRNSPFHGTEFRGGPVATIVNGSIVWRHDA